MGWTPNRLSDRNNILIFYPEDKGSMLVRNVGKQLQECRVP
jgi:hypothetical protein